MIHVAPVALASAVVTLLLTPLVAALARRLGALDEPGPRKPHSRAVPRLGGVAVVGGAGLGLWIADSVSEAVSLVALLPVLGGAAIVFAIGVVDDLRPRSPWLKLALELLAACVVVAGGIAITSVTLLGTTFSLGPLSYLVTVLWIVGLTNAFNLIDGVDGLAAGIALISGSTCAFISALRGNDAEAAVLVALAGAAAGFLPWNLPPARIFLGDGGSLVFGFTLAVTAITGLQKGATALSSGAVLLLFALPIIEVLVSLVRRSVKGARRQGVRGLLEVLAPDQEHLHHRLLASGMTPVGVLGLLYALTLALSLLAVATARLAG
jgi:UDP-GlcNAc:undecaprenyl-phosphate GlcNAc-1-phosphate transferase